MRALDAERFLADPALNEPASEDDLEMARRLIAERSAEDIAAALVRLYRARLPAIEDVTDPGERPRDGPPAAGLQRAPRARADALAPEDRDYAKPARTGAGGKHRARRAAPGSASTSAAPRAPIRNGCCR